MRFFRTVTRMSSHDSPPSLWRRFTAAYAKFLTGLLAFSVAIIIIPVTLQMISRYTALVSDLSLAES